MTRIRGAFTAIRERLPFLDYVPIVFTSALTCEGVPQLFDRIDRVGEHVTRRLAPNAATGILRRAIERRPLSLAGVPLRLQSAAQVGILPATFAIRVNQPAGIHFSYKRYLVNALRDAVDFSGTPIRLAFKRGAPRKARR
jgi:GTP-binding protein